MGSRDFNELNWHRVDDGFDDIEGGFDDGTFYGLEEIDDVDVVKDSGILKLVPRSKDVSEKKKTKKTPKSTKRESKAKSSKKSKSTEESAKKEDEDDNAFSALSKVQDDPVYSLGTWPSGLDWRIYTGLRDKSFLSPTDIQAQSIPLIMAGYDVIGKAATGSGKTLAYSLPLLNRYYQATDANKNDSVDDHSVSGELAEAALMEQQLEKPSEDEPTSDSESGDDFHGFDEEDAPQKKLSEESSDVARRPEGLIVSPTRELAHQIRDHLQAILPPSDKSKIVALTGGLAIQKQLRQLSKSPAIVVATPGRLLEILEQMSARQQHAWQRIPSLVLDEADRLVQSGSFAELESAMKIIGVSFKRQVLVYSATFNTELWGNLSSNRKRKREDIRDIMSQKFGLNSTAHLVDVDPEGQVAESVRQALIECPNMEKDLYAYYFLLLYPGKSILFVNSIDTVKRSVPLFKELGLTAFGVHSEMIQKQRLRSIERFKATKNAVLVATDVAARGLDVPLVDHVLHYHLPRSADMYVHRSGRTARAGNMGVSVALCSPQEASGPLPNLLKLIHTKPQHINIDYDILEKVRERVRLAKKIADIQMLATKKGKTESWLNEAAEELGIDIDESFAKLDGRGGKSKNKASEPNGDVNELKAMRAELADMLSRKSGTNRRYLTSGSQNLAHEMLKQKNSPVLGKPMKSALDELTPKTKQNKPVAISADSSAANIQKKPTKKVKSK